MQQLLTSYLSMTRKSWFVYLLTGIALVYALAESFQRNDFDIFLAASSDLMKGQDIYSAKYFEWYHYYYSVFFASVIYPLTWIPAPLAHFVWLVLQLIMMVRIAQLIAHYLSDLLPKGVDWTWFLTLLFLLSLRFWRGNLHLGQMTILLLWLMIEGLHRIREGQSIRGGALIGLGINIKLLPLVVLPYLFYRGYWKGLATTLVCTALLFALPYLWLDDAYHTMLLESWWHLINPAGQRHVLDVEETSFHGLSTLLATLCIADLKESQGLQTPRHIVSLTLEQLHIAIWIARLILVAGMLWFLRSWPWKNAEDKQHSWWEWSYLLLVIPLIFPHQQHYAFVLALPALAWCLMACWNLPNGFARRAYLMAFTLVVVVFNLSLWLGAFTAYYNHYKILTYGALLLTILMAWTTPARMHHERIR